MSWTDPPAPPPKECRYCGGLMHEFEQIVVIGKGYYAPFCAALKNAEDSQLAEGAANSVVKDFYDRMLNQLMLEIKERTR